MYFNEEKSNLLRIHVDVTLSDLKDQLDQVNGRLNYRETRRVDNVEYLHPSTDYDLSIRFTQMKHQNDDNLRIMFSIFDQHTLKGPIELDTSLVSSFKDIRERLNHPRTNEEIRVCIDRTCEDLSLADPLSCMCFIMLLYVINSTWYSNFHTLSPTLN